jgi:hypothetical protein
MERAMAKIVSETEFRDWLGAYLDMIERDRTELHVLRDDGRGSVAFMDADKFVRMRERSHQSRG